MRWRRKASKDGEDTLVMDCTCTMGVLQKGAGKGFGQKPGAREPGTYFGTSPRRTAVKNRSDTLSRILRYTTRGFEFPMHILELETVLSTLG